MINLTSITRHIPEKAYAEVLSWHKQFCGGLIDAPIKLMPAQTSDPIAALQPTFVVAQPLIKQPLLERQSTGKQPGLGYRLRDPIGSIWFMQTQPGISEPRLNAIAIKTICIDSVRDAMRGLLHNELQFVLERHGDGPLHYSTSFNALTFEIYPVPDSKRSTLDSRLRDFSYLDLHFHLNQNAQSQSFLQRKLNLLGDGIGIREQKLTDDKHSQSAEQHGLISGNQTSAFKFLLR